MSKAAAFVLLAACAPATIEVAPAEVARFLPLDPQAHCPRLANAEVVFRITDPRLPEISGVAKSSKHKGVLYVVNDSGNPAEIFALGTDGVVKSVLTVEPAENFDWEAISARGPQLFAFDTGDNLHVRIAGAIYVVDEPDTLEPEQHVRAERRDLRYPDGRENVEAAAIEPESGDIYYWTRGDDRPATLYKSDGTRVASFAFGERERRGSNLTTDASFHGRRFALRTYTNAYLWERAADEAWEKAFQRAPCVLALEKDRQGEAIALTDDGFFTLSEGVGEPVRFYRFE